MARNNTVISSLTHSNDSMASKLEILSQPWANKNQRNWGSQWSDCQITHTDKMNAMQSMWKKIYFQCSKCLHTVALCNSNACLGWHQSKLLSENTISINQWKCGWKSWEWLQQEMSRVWVMTEIKVRFDIIPSSPTQPWLFHFITWHLNHILVLMSMLSLFIWLIFLQCKWQSSLFCVVGSTGLYIHDQYYILAPWDCGPIWVVSGRGTRPFFTCLQHNITASAVFHHFSQSSTTSRSL